MPYLTPYPLEGGAKKFTPKRSQSCDEKLSEQTGFPNTCIIPAVANGLHD